MKSILLFTASFFTGVAISQITVTQANIAVPTDVVIQDHDTMPSIAAPSSGANQTWNYATGLVAHTEDTMFFGMPGWLNNASFFPMSNLAATQGGGFEIYLVNDASSLRTVGMAGNMFGTGDRQIYMNPPEVILQYPANYNDTYTTNSIQRFSFPGSDVGAPVDSIVNKTYQTKIVSIDSWGSLTTPLGTFNVLRVSEDISSVDSTWTYMFGMETLVNNGSDMRYNYAFWSDDPSARFPVMEMSHDNAGTIYSVSWLKASPTGGINESNLDQVKLYPNPSNGEVIIAVENHSNLSVSIYTLNGLEVKHFDLMENETTIDISDLSKGVYLIDVTNNTNNQIIYSERVVLNK